RRQRARALFRVLGRILTAAPQFDFDERIHVDRVAGRGEQTHWLARIEIGVLHLVIDRNREQRVLLPRVLVRRQAAGHPAIFGLAAAAQYVEQRLAFPTVAVP